MIKPFILLIVLVDTKASGVIGSRVLQYQREGGLTNGCGFRIYLMCDLNLKPFNWLYRLNELM
jgi:hypothetical protein